MACFTEIPHDDKVQMLVDFCDCKLPVFTGRSEQLKDPMKDPSEDEGSKEDSN